MSNFFCQQVNFLPSLSHESIELINKFYRQNITRFTCYSNVNKVTQIIGEGIRLGFGIINFNLGSELYTAFNQMLISDNIRIKSSGLGIQRSLKRIPPHTDPGRNVSLLYNIKGPAVTDFYEIDNFIPNIEYNPQDLKLKASVEMKLHKWYLFNNASIHGVKNIPDFERVAFVIHFHGIFKNFEEASANLKNLTYDR